MSLGRMRSRSSYPVGSIHWRPTPKPPERRFMEWVRRLISKVRGWWKT